MGTILVHPATTEDPMALVGEFSGTCWSSPLDNIEKNRQRGLDCLHSGHWRTLEFVQVYLIIDGYSARVVRELYTHLGGQPTRLQASTRYINYRKFDYVTPSSIEANPEARKIYESTMDTIAAAADYMEGDLDIKREDVGMILPLGMETKMVYRTNLRSLVDMAKQRLCTRAYHEYRALMKDMIEALRNYSDEWKTLIDEEQIFRPKCEWEGCCRERYSCGRAIGYKDFKPFANLANYCFKKGIKPEQLEIEVKYGNGMTEYIYIGDNNNE